ncbi:MAG TPA: molybdopterin dinucleotide binding domain-containing protein, partial [Pararhizobium sp.]|nr:molybdopterin dinucleotide binding domain-containing protein [Pararhizobium sp.]
MRRRDALKVLATGLAATLAGCTDPKEIIVPYEETLIPYVDMPEGLVPGEPQYYATALPMAGFGRGALVKAIDGRPIKVEGNPRHPASLGATDIFMQSEILSLYEPDRSGTVAGPQPVVTWETFFTALVPRMRALDGTKGAGLHFVTGRITSPTLKRQIAGLMRAFPQAQWHAYESAEGDLAELPAERHRPRLDRADVIVSLDADPLGPGPDQVVNGHEFAERRDPTSNRSVSRVYVVESSRTLTGANCDHRLSLRPDEIDTFAVALAGYVTGGSSNAGDKLPKTAQNLMKAIAGDVTLPGMKALLLPGETLSPEARTALMKANQKLGAEFETTSEDRSGLTPLADLWSALEAGKVSDLVMLDCNPAYDFPDEKLAGAIKKVAFSVHAGTLQNETARMSRWHLPLSHVLESWSDIAATDGTVSIIQPLIRPLYATRTTHEIVAMMMGDPAPSAYETVRQTWRGGRNDAEFETWWRKTLTAGIVPAVDVAAATTSEQAGPPPQPQSPSPAPTKDGGKGKFAAVIRPDPSLYDGAHADNALLQECPKPIGKTTWTNVVTLSEADAKKLGVADDEVVSIEAAAGKIEGPVLVDKAQVDGIVGLTLGYGRTAAGTIGTGLGYNARQLSPRSFASLVPAVDVKATGRRQLVPTTQDHFKLEGDFQHLMPIVTGAADFKIDSEARPSSGQHFNHPNPRSDG